MDQLGGGFMGLRVVAGHGSVSVRSYFRRAIVRVLAGKTPAPRVAERVDPTWPGEQVCGLFALEWGVG